MYNMITILPKVSILLAAGIMSTNGSPQNVFGDVRYLVRMVNVTLSDSKGVSMLSDEKWRMEDFMQVYSASIKVPRTFVIRRYEVRFERCLDLELACENFLTWNVTGATHCAAAKMQNQMWSPIVFSLKEFYQTCPRMNQGVYKLENARLDWNLIVMYYNEAPKYYWKIYSFFYNPKNEIEMFVYMHLFFVKYTKRHRKD